LTNFLITFKYLFGLLFIIGLHSFTYNPPEEIRHDKYFGTYSKKYYKISIENGPRQGNPYFDSKGTKYSYLNITTTITNDSLVPIRLRISFSKEYNYLRSKNILKSKIFLLPSHLTPEALKQFLDTNLDVPASLDTILNPKERVVMTFGMLTEMKYEEFPYMELISTDKQFHLNTIDSLKKPVHLSKDIQTFYLALDIINNRVIPCGQISFLNHK
jgi:hypothetical protein